MLRCLDNRRANAIAQRGGDLWRAVDHDHPDLGVYTQNCPQACRHLGGGFDPGETTAGHHHGVAGRAGWLVF
ncbi:hypothetical protein D3C76_1716590 [compost metagenome]